MISAYAARKYYNHEVSIAEYVLMAMLMLVRLPQAHDRELRAGNWDSSCVWGEPPTLRSPVGSTALILGLGHIAAEIVARLAPLASAVSASRQPKPTQGMDRVVGYETWREELPQADFLIPCCPLTEETRGLIGQPTWRCCGREPVWSTWRGPGSWRRRGAQSRACDGGLTGAALDVWYQIRRRAASLRYPSRFPFHELRNVLMTPHSSGLTTQTVEGRMRDVAENINLLAGGEPLRNVVR